MKWNEIYRNETERNETKWNVHKNWKGMQFNETNIPKRNKTEYVETYMSVPSPIWMTIGHINGCSCRRSCGWFFLSMFMWLSVNTARLCFLFNFNTKRREYSCRGLTAKRCYVYVFNIIFNIGPIHSSFMHWTLDIQTPCWKLILV
jgi:hypothetical protein